MPNLVKKSGIKPLSSSRWDAVTSTCIANIFGFLRRLDGMMPVLAACKASPSKDFSVRSAFVLPVSAAASFLKQNLPVVDVTIVKPCFTVGKIVMPKP